MQQPGSFESPKRVFPAAAAALVALVIPALLFIGLAPEGRDSAAAQLPPAAPRTAQVASPRPSEPYAPLKAKKSKKSKKKKSKKKSESAQARALLKAQIAKHPILEGTTVEFGDARGYQAVAYYTSGRIVISRSHKVSLKKIVNHEVWHVIDWRDNHRIDWGENVPPN